MPKTSKNEDLTVRFQNSEYGLKVELLFPYDTITETYNLKQIRKRRVDFMGARFEMEFLKTISELELN